MKGDEFYHQLENDLKNLAAEAKRSDTFTGQLSGLLLLSGPEHPHIREATERSLTKLKAWKEGDFSHTFVIDKVSVCMGLTICVLTYQSASPSFDLEARLTVEEYFQDFLKPFLAACESKSSKLTVTALISLQRQLANDAILHRDVIAVVHALEQVSPFCVHLW